MGPNPDTQGNFFPPHGNRRKGTAVNPLDQDEITDHGDGNTAKYRSEIPELLRIIEGKNNPDQILDQCSEGKCEDDGYQNTRNNCQGIAGIHIMGKIGNRTALTFDFDQRNRHRRSKQLENQRYRSGGRKTQGIEGIQQNHVGDHDRQKKNHDLGKNKHVGVKHPFPGYLHHPRRKSRPDENPQRCQQENHPLGSGF